MSKAHQLATQVYDSYIELNKCLNQLVGIQDLTEIRECIACLVAYQKIFNDRGIALARRVLNDKLDKLK